MKRQSGQYTGDINSTIFQVLQEQVRKDLGPHQIESLCKILDMNIKDFLVDRFNRCIAEEVADEETLKKVFKIIVS